MNRLVLSARMVERAALRYTPAGLPALDVSLKHESEVVHDGRPRKVWFEIKARGVGAITESLARTELGAERRFGGFLGSQRNGRGIVFHVTELD
jgi:primosomal replication protein N